MTRDVCGYIWWAFIALWAIIRSPHVWRAKFEPIRTTRRDLRDWIARSVAVWGLGVIPGAYTLTRFPQGAERDVIPQLAWIGTVLFVLSLWLFHCTHRDLGRRFSPSLEIRQQHSLVTTGIYTYVRHPMYAAFWLWAIAQALVLPNWFVDVAGILGMAYLYAARMPREENLMLQEFGEQYRSYMNRTARLLPGVY